MPSSPLSDFEKKKILFYLGYSVFEDNGPAMRAIHSLDSQPLAPDFIRPVLEQLDQLTEEFKTVIPLAKAIATASLQIRAHYTFQMFCRMGRRLVGQLASWIKVSVFSDVFSNGAAYNPATFYSGDPSEHRIDPVLGVPTTRS